MIDQPLIAQLEAELVAKFGEPARARAHRGIAQAARLWRPTDGDFAAFVREHFIADDATLESTLERMEVAFEQIDGHMNEIGRELHRATDTDIGRLMPVDSLLAGIDLSSHVVEDLFSGTVGFEVLLNFPLTTLAERESDSAHYSRRDWAAVRLASRFARRVPAAVQQEAARVGSQADLYIAQYNVWMHHVLTADGERLFPKGLRLISHWNLRDELKADYTDAHGLAKQRVIAKVMERIVTETIPAAVIDNPRLDWNPFSNDVRAASAETVEQGGSEQLATPSPAPEPDTRYQHWLAQFRAARAADPYSPIAPTAIARSFDIGRELREERVVALLKSVLTSPVVPRVAALIRTELGQRQAGRELEPHDLWYNGFQARGRTTEAELDAITRAKYPKTAAFAADIPRILEQLGFAKERVAFIASHIAVDPARGAGHAMPAMRRGDLPRLRTRVGSDGMDYKGYNIAIHELGHNVEQVISLYEVDHTLLAGIPNTAFTEAFAFVFQARDLELLGLAKRDAEAERRRVLNDFWMTYEIAGVGLVDVAAWHWMYEHPDATPAALRDAVVGIAREVWNRYYAPVLGGTDSVLLAVYSHLIAYPLYVCDYPLGHLIAFQIEEHFQGLACGSSQPGCKAPTLGAEFERMASFGAVSPDTWMQHATGGPVSAEPLLRATAGALEGR
jgi:hypothetical protein